MANFAQFFEKFKAASGGKYNGLVNLYRYYPNDLGAEKDSIVKLEEFPNSEIPEAVAKDILQLIVWDKLLLDKFKSQKVADLVAFGAIKAGMWFEKKKLPGYYAKSHVGKHLQNACNTPSVHLTRTKLVVDGIIGPKTLTDVNYISSKKEALLYNELLRRLEADINYGKASTVFVPSEVSTPEPLPKDDNGNDDLAPIEEQPLLSKIADDTKNTLPTWAILLVAFGVTTTILYLIFRRKARTTTIVYKR